MATDLTGLDDAVANVTGQKQQVAAAGVRNNMQFAPAANPDAEAEHRHLAQYLSQPLDTVRADPEQARVQASLLATDADRLAADAPQTADLLNDPSNARMLHDQIPNVAATEQAVGTLAAQPHQNPWSDAANYVFGSGIASSDKANWNKPSLVGDVARAVVSGFDSMAKGVNIVGGAIPTAADAWSSLLSGQKTTDMSDAYFKSMVDPIVARMGENALPKDAGFVRRVVDASGKLVPTLAAIAVTGGAAEAPAASESITNVVANAVSHAIKSMAVPSTTSAVTTASDVLNAGGSGIEAGTAGAAQFGVSSAQGVMPLSAPGGLLTRALGGGASFAVTSELGRQAMNAVTPDSMQQPFDPEEVLVNAIMGGALGGIHGPRPAPDMAAAIRQTYTDAANAAQAGQTMDTLQKLGELATTGKFRERDPQAFNQFVNDVVDQTGAPDLYVDGRKLAEALDQGNVSAAELSAKLPDVADQMREALQSEGTVKISLADYATHIAGGPLDASLLPHLKTEPGGMTYDEAQQFHQDQVDQLTPEAQVMAAADTEKVDARTTELQGVHDTVLDQLNATGRYPTDVSKAYSALTRDFYGTMAERTGQTPAELFAAHPLHVAAESLSEPGTVSGNTLSHEGLDKSVPFEPRVDGSRTSAQDLADVFESDASGAESNSTRGIPPFETVLSKVRTAALEKPEILDSIVRAVPVDVVNRLFGSESAAKEALHNEPMFKNGSALDTELPVSKAVDAASPIGLLLREGARVAAEQRLGARGTGSEAQEGGAAVSANERDSLSQGKNPRAEYTPAQNLIVLLRDADLTSYLHELGHHFLETTARLAAEPGAPEGIANDFRTLLTEHGLGDSPADWLAKPLDERRDVHENFARGFEAYLMEGKAPTPELQSLFGRFRSWLLQVYKSLSALHVQLSPEVRGVMDRMLATDAEIKQAEAVRSMEAMFKAKPDGMTDEAYEKYQALGSQATEDAVANLQARSLRDMQWLSNAKSKAMRDLQKQASTERATIQEEVTAEVDQMPAFAAKDQLDRETDPNRAFRDQQAEWRTARDAQPKDKRADWIKDNPEPTKPRTVVDDWKDQRQAFEEQVRATVKKAAAGDAKGLAKGQALMKAKRSIDNEVERSMIEWEQANPKPKIDKPKADLELVAEQHGFNTADEMLRAIDDAGKKSDVIEALTDQRMLERHGDLVDPRSIERAAEAAVHNDARTRFLATELTSLAKATGSPRMLAKAAQEAADAAIAAKRVRDLRPDQYSSAEARAGRAADKAFKAGDIQTAAIQKRAQLLSNTLARSATDAAGEIAKSVEYLKKFDKESIREKVDVAYRDQIDQLLAAHDLRTSVSGKALDKRVSLKDFVEREQAAGREPMVPQDLIDEANQVHYKDMTVESFRGLVDAVRSLDHLGRLKTKILDGRDARDFKAVVDEAVASMGALPQRDPETNRGLSAVDKKWLGVKSTIRSADSSLLKMEQVIDWLDGHDANGVMNRVVFRRIADAGTRENDLRTDIVGKLHELAASQPKGYGKDFDEKLSLPGLIDTKTGKTQILLKRELLSAALNRGNESNWQKLLKGEKGWNEAALLRAFDEHLTKADWDYVQGVWHSINSLWPEIDAMERRLGNTSPEKIAPRAFDTPHGTYEGGYYPAVYDPLRSFDVEQNRQRSSESLFENNYQKATTSKGHTIERSENYARPFLLSLDVIPRHMTQVIHDIAYREAVMDADRFLADPRVREGVEGALGREYYQQFRPWLQALANDKVYDSRGLAFWDKAAHWARTTTTMVGLGYRISTMLIHGATAASNSVGEIGTKWMLSGVRDVLGTPQKMADSRDFIFERSGEMRHRMGEVDRDIRDQLREMEAKAATGLTGRTAEVINGVKRAAFYGVAMLDFASAMPTWMGAYNRGLHEGLAEQEAVYAADKAVRNAHGGTGTKDLAAIQRGPEFQKLFTMFYSFWNHFYNRQRDLGRAATQIPGKIAEGDYAGARRDFAMVLARSFFYFIAPQLLHAALKPPAPGTQDEEENWAHWAAKELALGMFSGVPVVRDVANSISTGRDYNPTPAVSIVKSVAATAKDVHGVATGQGPSDKWVQHAVQTAGYVFGLPTGQVSNAAQFLWDVGDGKQSPQGLADWWHGLKDGHL